MNVVIGTDHRGFEYKEFIKSYNDFSKNILWLDVGCHSSDSCDYPIFAREVVQNIQSGKAQAGILLCGTGVGMSIAANRFEKIYAGLAWNKEVARLNKEHDKVNVLVIPADFVTRDQALEMVSAWVEADFLGGKYQKRIDLIDSF